MTLLRARLRTKQRRSLWPRARIESLRDSAIPHQRQESDFVSRPVLGVAIGTEQFGGWRQTWLMRVANPSDFLHKVCEVWMFGETGELTTAVQPDIDEFFHLRLLEEMEKLFGSFSGESDRA